MKLLSWIQYSFSQSSTLDGLKKLPRELFPYFSDWIPPPQSSSPLFRNATRFATLIYFALPMRQQSTSAGKASGAHKRIRTSFCQLSVLRRSRPRLTGRRALSPPLAFSLSLLCLVSNPRISRKKSQKKLTKKRFWELLHRKILYNYCTILGLENKHGTISQRAFFPSQKKNCVLPLGAGRGARARACLPSRQRRGIHWW